MKWHRRLLGIGLIILAFELGLFLLIIPWLDSWSMNWIPVHSARFAGLWMSGYFRGSLSGLGLLNIYVALGEAIKQITSLIHRSPAQQ
jgi:hypothetical protein